MKIQLNGFPKAGNKVGPYIPSFKQQPKQELKPEVKKERPPAGLSTFATLNYFC